MKYSSPKWTGIPIMKMLQGERENCCIWKKNYTDVVGQEEGIEAVSDAVKKKSCRITRHEKTSGYFSFLVQPALVKQNWQKHWQNTCLMMKMP
jgi:ATP-dependent Clp protease ATP-binding subunit ClpA